MQRLTNANPSLLDAVTALTNQTFIQATFQPPLLLLHTTEDSWDGFATVKNEKTAAKLHQRLVPGLGCSSKTLIGGLCEARSRAS